MFAKENSRNTQLYKHRDNKINWRPNKKLIQVIYDVMYWTLGGPSAVQHSYAFRM